MSLRNRARRLQRATGLSYQQALARLRSLGAAAAELRAQTGWPLWKCDLYLVDPARVDAEPASADRSGGSPASATRSGHRLQVAVSPREAAGGVDPVTAVCDWLLEMTGARAVWLVGARGELLVALPPRHAPSFLPLAARLAGPATASHVPPRQPLLLDLGADRVYAAPVAGGRTLAVRFDASTSLGLVRLRTRRAAGELEAIFRRRDAPPGMPPGAAGSGAGGAPAQAFAWRPPGRDSGPD